MEIPPGAGILSVTRLRGLHMKTFFAAGTVIIAAMLITCTSAVISTDTGQNAAAEQILSAAPDQPSAATVTCTDTTSDAASLQQAINSSSPGALIAIGGTCLLTQGIVFLGDRTYAGYNTTGTVLEQDGDMS
jgi:hypothetical protein